MAISHGISPLAPHLMKSKHFSHHSHSSIPYSLGNNPYEPDCPSSANFLNEYPHFIYPLGAVWGNSSCEATLSAVCSSTLHFPPLSITVAHFHVNFHTQLSTWKSMKWTFSPLHSQNISEYLDKIKLTGTYCIRN